jgi:signal transduction histidine kinase/ActR/RegA family two-component response regulator
MLDWCLKTLRGRFLAVAGLFFVVSSLALTSFHFLHSRATLLDELEKRGFSVTENFVFRMGRVLETGDLEALAAEVEAACATDDIQYVIVQDPDGQVLAERAAPGIELNAVREVLAATSWSPDRPESFELQDSGGNRLHNFSAPIPAATGGPGYSDSRHPGRLATVRVGFTTATALQSIENAFRLSLSLWLVICLVGLAGIFVVTGWALKPIGVMASVAHSIAAGDMSRRVEVTTRDEIGALGHAFNEMTGSLAASREALARRNLELEEVALEKERSYVQLKEAQERLAQSENTRQAEKLRTVGQMASGVAHDFNNILSVICGRVQLLKMKSVTSENLPPGFFNALEIIERAALDGAETVHRIQEFSRDRGGQPMQRGDLNHIVREAVETTRPRWKNQTEQEGLHVDVLMTLTRVPGIACVPSEIREVLTNLIFNAVDAMPDGGRIVIATSPHRGGTCVTVTDSGTGMPPEVRERIFEPFYTTKGVKGNGLGLSIVYGIIQRHGGDISVAPGPDGGTQFRINLPPAAAGTVEGSREVMMVNQPSRILIADDEFNVRQALGELLIALGHEVVEAHNGREAIARFEAGTFDMVFTDLGMPDLSGWEVAAEIRRQNADVPIVLVTGWGNQIDATEARARGVTRVVAKPFTVQKVSSLIAEIQGGCEKVA